MLKARQEKDPRYEEYLSRFASATFDRAHLYNLLASLDLKEEERGEVLELLELEELELTPLENTFSEALPSRLNELPTPEPAPVSFDMDYPDEPVILPPRQEPPPPPSRAGMVEWVSVAATYSQLLPALVRAARPEDPAVFAAKVAPRSRNANLSDRLRKLRRRQQAASPRKSSPDTGGEGGVVVSETLAALLVRQEQYQSAIKMYRRLILLYPEKKPIFAGLIEKLKEKL
ncbi:hypothetical protein GGR26_003233 [Lewinella marina]|uniref:Tetratricopeptide repeat protein n=1 Tax=Neolewinella marina TaxID=438751 RepID=A0A2G0CE35_9BACT|nr:hypothetical protein [Neolewinella marina]NJB87453.1 hypothetical protein [Neolewinella marina]PHK98238.1 hypothetical protein CGL56_11075 [Neolewinella marina]